MNKNMSNTPRKNFYLSKSITYFGLFLGISLISLSAYAGGSIFGGHKHKTSNLNGVYSIGLHICSSLECPPVRIVTGKCDGDHMSKHWGVCVCDEGYEAKGNICVETTDVDVGVCDNGNVYLSYMDDPCATYTPMAGKDCTSDSDCKGHDPNTGCCDTTLNKCKSWMNTSDYNEDYICPTENNRACKKNSDCHSGEFCNLVSTEDDYNKPDTGTCTAIGEINTYTYINGTNKTFTVSLNRLTWWGAENWCQAQGKSLVSYITLHNLFECERNTWSCKWDKFYDEANWQDGKNLISNYWGAENYDSRLASALLPVYNFFSYAPHSHFAHALCE